MPAGRFTHRPDRCEVLHVLVTPAPDVHTSEDFAHAVTTCDRSLDSGSGHFMRKVSARGRCDERATVTRRLEWRQCGLTWPGRGCKRSATRSAEAAVQLGQALVPPMLRVRIGVVGRAIGRRRRVGLVREGGVGDDAAAQGVDGRVGGRRHVAVAGGHVGLRLARSPGARSPRARSPGARPPGARLSGRVPFGWVRGGGEFWAAAAIWSRRSMSCLTERTKSPGVRPGTESRTSSSLAPRAQR